MEYLNGIHGYMLMKFMEVCCCSLQWEWNEVRGGTQRRSLPTAVFSISEEIQVSHSDLLCMTGSTCVVLVVHHSAQLLCSLG